MGHAIVRAAHTAVHNEVVLKKPFDFQQFERSFQIEG
jgi:hypothetical protein